MGRFVSLGTRRRVYYRDGYRCVYCKQGDLFENLTIDHVVPWCRGGRNGLANLVTACWSCNNARGSKPAGSFVPPPVPRRRQRGNRQPSKRELVKAWLAAQPVTTTTFGDLVKAKLAERKAEIERRRSNRSAPVTAGSINW